MARTWTLKEIVETIHSNDIEGIKDICRRFPVTAIMVAKTGYEQALTFLSGIPEYVTVISVEKQLTNNQDAQDPDEEAEAKEEKEEEAAPAKEEKQDPKERKREMDRKRQQRKRAKDRAEKELEEEAAKADKGADGEEQEAGKYDEIGAVELFKMCKARGLEAKSRQPQRFYIDLLEADDQAKAKEAQEEDDDEDWGEEAPGKAEDPGEEEEEDWNI